MNPKNTPFAESEIPTKEQLIEAMTEQIEVKEVQLKLQKLNEELAKSKAGELQALNFTASMKEPASQGTEHTITQEDLDNNPDLVEQGFKVGDDVFIPNEAQAPAKRNLKNHERKL